MDPSIADNLTLLLIGAVFILIVAFGISEDAPVTRRIFVQFLFNIALPLVVVLGVPLVLIAANTDLDESIWAAIIAGVVIASGWLTSAIFAELGKSRGKAERLRDYHKAIYAEIGHTLEVLYDRGQAEAEAARIVDMMRADPDFVPFIPKEEHDFVYDALVGDIEVLPRVTIDFIVAYYSLIKSNAAQGEDMRGDYFRGTGLTQTRRIQMYSDYFETRKSAFALGQHTLRVIKEFSDNGAAAAELLSKRLSNQDAGRSARSQGSE